MPLIRNPLLVTEDYQNAFNDGNGNAITVPITPMQVSANIGAALRDYLISLPIINGTFNGNINYYNRQDYTMRAMPAINLYPVKEKASGNFGWYDGSLGIRIVFDLSNYREIVVDEAMDLANLIWMYTNGTDMLDYVSQYTPGLKTLGYNQQFDYKRTNVLADGKQINAFEVMGVAQYRVSVLEYYQGLWPQLALEETNVQISTEG